MNASAPVHLPAWGNFTEITPSLPRAHRDNSAWAAAILNGQLYLAWLAFDEQRQRDSRVILCFSHEAGTWQTVYEKMVSASRTRRKQSLDKHKSSDLSALIKTYRASTQEALYVQFVSPLGKTQLCCSGKRAEFRNIRADSGELAAALALCQKLTSKRDEYGLFWKEGRKLLRRRSLREGAVRWMNVSTPSRTQSGQAPQLSHITSFNGKLAIAIDDSKEGFHLWTRKLNSNIPQEWEHVLRRGAQRYSMNSNILACVPWNGALYVVSGSGKRRSPVDHKGGFEILRVYGDGSWDLVVGAPRVTDSGLKVPLSCLGPGMDEFMPARFCFLADAGRELLLGTYEDIPGLRIWQSLDGEVWSVNNGAEFVGIEKIRKARAFPISAGTALLLEFENSPRGRAFDILLHPSGSAREGSESDTPAK